MFSIRKLTWDTKLVEHANSWSSLIMKIIADNPPNLERIPKDSVDDDYYFIESCDTIDIYIYIPNLIIMSLSSVDIHISVEWVIN